MKAIRAVLILLVCFVVVSFIFNEINESNEFNKKTVALDSLLPGMTRSDVLKKVGSPSRVLPNKTWYKNLTYPQELWVYEKPSRSVSGDTFVLFLMEHDFLISVSVWGGNRGFNLSLPEVNTIMNRGSIEFNGIEISLSGSDLYEDSK